MLLLYHRHIFICVEVLGHRRRCSQPANLPVSDSMLVHDGRNFAEEFRRRFSTLKAEFDEVYSFHLYNTACKL